VPVAKRHSLIMLASLIADMLEEIAINRSLADSTADQWKWK
jgi:hypothetical protein